METISKHITAVINGKHINEIPENVREQVASGVQVRLARHAGHSTAHNPDGTVTVTNSRIRVTLPESNFRSREHVFTGAMRVLGHRSELNIPVLEPTDDEVRALAIENLTMKYLSENCRYNLYETLMRMIGGHIVPGGMQADIAAAIACAQLELNENPAPHIQEAKQQIHEQMRRDREYHERIASCCINWKIEIIGPMPTQIGTCEYRREA